MDIAETWDYGEDKIAGVIRHIRERGHDVGIHIHLDHMADKKRLFFSEYSRIDLLPEVNQFTGDNITVYVAYKDEMPQAGGVFYYNQQMCYYMYGATAMEAFIRLANLLIWTAICDMKELDVKKVQFCRLQNESGCGGQI